MDENYQCLKDEATKTKQALENAFTEKETQKAKLVSTYKLFDKTDDEIDAIFLEIESNRENTGLTVDKGYNDAYWKWRDADEVNEKAQTSLKKYDENYNADIPDVMIELKEVKQQNEELKKEMQEMKNEMQEVKYEMKEELQEVKYVLKSQNEVLNRKLHELQRQNEEMKKEMQRQNEELKNKMEAMMMQVLRNFERQRQEELERQRQEELERQRQEELERQRQEELERQQKLKEFFSNITPAFNGENEEMDIVFPEPVEARYITFKPKAWNNNNPFLRCEVYVDNVLQHTPFNQRSFSSYDDDSFKDSTMDATYGWRHKSPYNTNEWLKLDLQQGKTITGIRVGTYPGNASYYVSNLALEFGN